MRIAEIPQTSEITVKMVHNNKELSVKTRVLTAYGEGILVTPIFCEDQVLEYCSKARIEYKNPSTGLVHTFESDSIARTDFNGTDFHVIRGKEIFLSDRKRKAERYMVQVMGQAVVNKRKTINVIINDISMRGVSLLIGKDQNSAGRGVKRGQESPQLSYSSRTVIEQLQERPVQKQSACPRREARHEVHLPDPGRPGTALKQVKVLRPVLRRQVLQPSGSPPPKR